MLIDGRYQQKYISVIGSHVNPYDPPSQQYPPYGGCNSDFAIGRV
jgi:hypothetical protein